MEVLLINELPSQVSPHCYFDWVGGLFFFFFLALLFLPMWDLQMILVLQYIMKENNKSNN